MTKFQSLYEDFRSALERFDEILKEPKNDIVRDSAIKRFELVFELAWKTTKAYLEDYHNGTCVSPRECFREAFRIGLIEHDEHWIGMTATRNYTVHAYKQALAEKIYVELPQTLIMFKKLAEAFEKNKSA
ncbi:MAG: hypothetical protein A3G49_02375 [Candidatus Sungbacteria bacterium RIFCSPLOWO2_12_FULL_41_11]|uniref:Nucleotidyltransferase n=1 Tax=Candidatus Sungbacteria bacterium RIFCSPLOWO2_12_FULL_41_11 TaxID=1802286 RepID=A0A1G2LNI6_9BACT|nr:MAG: Nucleotidyltransferase substrate binding protein, HI0074 family [Parcubacteria group bacterium GW2011_GWA2_42_14]OGZ98129.1 MAG: hypothetical protein A3D41_04065 [Candidatus Sungbacteria bacterium RIFCSPHIGHO2_02_FULL_41_12b]OHA13187.1 MAG: hypothetical protein A3G49_02375 [Candidatus Sungbacteria bacterium RIFCSPLOWO2_12_FULL_41_11]